MKLEKLNPQRHQHVQVYQTQQVYGSTQVHFSAVVPIEFAQAATVFPIVFCKHPQTALFQSVALFGLATDVNVFVKNGEWQAPYLPLSVSSQPFYLQQTVDELGNLGDSLDVFIDVHDPRVNQTPCNEGNLTLFNGQTASAYLAKQYQRLSELNQGKADDNGFIEHLLRYNLLIPLTLDIAIAADDNQQIVGFYTIDTEQLDSLSNDARVELRQLGHLRLIELAQQSLANIKTLVALSQPLVTA